MSTRPVRHPRPTRRESRVPTLTRLKKTKTKRRSSDVVTRTRARLSRKRFEILIARSPVPPPPSENPQCAPALRRPLTRQPVRQVSAGRVCERNVVVVVAVGSRHRYYTVNIAHAVRRGAALRPPPRRTAALAARTHVRLARAGRQMKHNIDYIGGGSGAFVLIRQGSFSTAAAAALTRDVCVRV